MKRKFLVGFLVGLGLGAAAAWFIHSPGPREVTRWVKGCSSS